MGWRAYTGQKIIVDMGAGFERERREMLQFYDEFFVTPTLGPSEIERIARVQYENEQLQQIIDAFAWPPRTTHEHH